MNMRQYLAKIRNKKGFTLVEVIIASSIFSIVSLIGVTVFINVTRIQKKLELENAIYEDGRFMMERMAREIRKNTIDYEEYYHQSALNDGGDYGKLNGCYAQQFYSPGNNLSSPYQAKCTNTDSNEVLLLPTDPNCVIDKKSLPINTGANPYQGSTGLPTNTSLAKTDQSALYLIDYQGTQKTIFAEKALLDTDGSQINGLGLLKLNGSDPKNYGVNTDWACADGFDCKDANNQTISNLFTTLQANVNGLDMTYKGFLPINPLRIKIDSLHFYVSPIEDPRKAFNETDGNIQQQPHVTVVMTLEPAPSQMVNFSGDPPKITIQQTISSRVYNEVKSFHSNLVGNVCQ